MKMDWSTIPDLEELFWWSSLFTDGDYKQALCLFHYTNASNLKKIIKKDCVDLRLTRADVFEDFEEGKHITSVFRSAVNQCLINKQIDYDFSQVLLSTIDDLTPMCEALRKSYVFCFSKQESNKYLIDNYACKNGNPGLIVGFKALTIEYLVGTRWCDEYPIHLLDVLYDTEKLSNNLQCLIAQAYQLKAQDNAQLTLIKKIAINQLAAYSMIYKSPQYQRENETRLIVDFKKVDPQSKAIFLDSNPKYIHILLKKTSLYNCQEVMSCQPTSHF